MKTNRLLMAITFTSVVMLGTSLYAQQDVDPTWYNPWYAPAKAAAQSQPLQFTKYSNQLTTASTLSRLQPEKSAGKNSVAGKHVQPQLRSTSSGKAAMPKKEGVAADSRRRQGRRAAQVASGSYRDSIEE